jgi:zinc transport system substrate-binding protein
MEFTRRHLLSAAAATAGTGLLAGCTGNQPTAGSESGETTAQASFLVFGDITDRVAGEAATTDLLVPIGQHGHGWAPGPRIREDIRDADLFVHGMNGFQPWVGDIEGDLEADGADVLTMDVSAGVDRLEAGGDHNHGGHDEGQQKEQDNEHETGHHEEDGTEHHEEGETEHHEEERSNDEHSEEHGSGMDPHFWMDPVRVKQATDNVRQGLADVDPDNADAYTENAEAFQRELEDLHRQAEEAVTNASKNAILIAGHDSLQYFADRYGVTVESLTNVSPDDRPTPRDIERAQEVIETHDLRYICSDPLESQQASEQLVAETDAEAVLPLTAMPGLTEEWKRKGWGYLEVMENVNLPTLERALGV